MLVILVFKCFYFQPIRAERVKRKLCAASRGKEEGKRIAALRMRPELTERPAGAAQAQRIQIRRLEFLRKSEFIKIVVGSRRSPSVFGNSCDGTDRPNSIVMEPREIEYSALV